MNPRDVGQLTFRPFSFTAFFQLAHSQAPAQTFSSFLDSLDSQGGSYAVHPPFDNIQQSLPFMHRTAATIISS